MENILVTKPSNRNMHHHYFRSFAIYREGYRNPRGMDAKQTSIYFRKSLTSVNPLSAKYGCIDPE